MEKEIIIKADNVVRKFGDRTVLDGISLEVYRGETFVIMGGSGCGKSTLLRVFNRMNDLIDGVRTSGEVLIDGEILSAPEPISCSCEKK